MGLLRFRTNVLLTLLFIGFLDFASTLSAEHGSQQIDHTEIWGWISGLWDELLLSILDWLRHVIIQSWDGDTFDVDCGCGSGGQRENGIFQPVSAFLDIENEWNSFREPGKPHLIQRIRGIYQLATNTETWKRRLGHVSKLTVLEIAAFCASSMFALCVLKWIYHPKKGNRTIRDAIASRYMALRLIRMDTNFLRFQIVSKKTKQHIFMKYLRISCSRKAHIGLAREYRTIESLSHPNIVHMVCWIRIGARCALGLEYANFGDLITAMTSPLSDFGFTDKLSVFRQVVEAVQYLHRSGGAHLNIRPESVLVFQEWSIVKLSGFSRVLKFEDKEDSHCSQYDLHKMSCPPEVLRRQAYNAFKADVWALGSLFYSILANNCLYFDAGLSLNAEFRISDFMVQQNDKLEKLLTSLVSSDPSLRPNLHVVVEILAELE